MLFIIFKPAIHRIGWKCRSILSIHFAINTKPEVLVLVFQTMTDTWAPFKLCADLSALGVSVTLNYCCEPKPMRGSACSLAQIFCY